MQKADSSKKIQDLIIDPAFIAKAEQLNIFTLQDVLECDQNELKANPAFTYSWYAILLKILKQEKVIHIFQKNL